VLGLLGDAYCFDIPMTIEAEIEESLEIDELEFNMLYSIFSLPNIILPIFGGILIDKLGVGLSLMIFSIIDLLGEAVVMFGAFKSNYTLMMIGRLILGVGSENL
jgi:MFS family permease